MATNDEMRNQYFDTYVLKVQEVGITFPDKNLKKNEKTGNWEFSDPDWDEFFRVINGDGPCNKERLAVRKWAEEHGRWVRKALFNPAEKYMIPLS